jgi:translation initiation factor IF-3
LFLGEVPIQTKRPYSGPPRSGPPRTSSPRPRLSGYQKPVRPDDGGLRINDQITVDRIRLIDAEGEMIGLSTVREGRRLADEAGLDLVEISPAADPPVCKVMDYGKYKYEQQKKANEARKKQKIVEVKELKFRPMIGDHDYQVKIRSAKSFLSEGDKVKITMRFRGRELENKTIAYDLMSRIKTDLAGLGKVEMEPKFEGRQMMMVIAADAKAEVAPKTTDAKPTDKPAS